PGQWRAKMVISCRSQYLGSDYRSRFQPTGDRYQLPTADLFQEAVIASFSKTQIEQYVEQYVQKAPSHTVDTTQPNWTVTDYMDKLNKIPKLIELVANPFLLTMALRALPKISRTEQDLSKIRLTRIGLYDNFIEEWLDTNKLRLESSSLSTDALEVLEILSNEGFMQVGITFQKELAAAIFQHQEGNPVVEYSHFRESSSWKTSFFGPDSQTTMLRESSPLARSGKQYRFLHRSILEYLYSRVISDPFESPQLSAHIGSDTNKSFESFADHPLNKRIIVSEFSIIQFLAERVQLEPSFKSRLLAMIEGSKLDAGVSQAAANAISILVRAGVWFNGADLRGISIPGADLHGGQFDSADMQGADLSNVNLTKTWLRQANLSDTEMTGVQFGELPYLEIGEVVIKCIFSSDGDLLVLSTQSENIIVYETATWTKIISHNGGYAVAISPVTRELAKQQDQNIEVGNVLTGEIRLVLSGHSDNITHISYSPDGEMIATSSYDDTIRIWSTSSGDTLRVLRGHTDSVSGVAFSPTGLQLVSCSNDKTVRTWNAQSGEICLVLEGHEHPILSMAYSPDGHQIASADDYEGLRLWDAHTGVFIRSLVGHISAIYGVAYSPNGHQLTSCDRDGAVRLWDPLNGELINTLSGHNNIVSSVSYSPSGDRIVSSSLDGTARLWDVGRALPCEEPNDSTNGLLCVDMSPDGAWTATGNIDATTVQLWETQTGKPGVMLKGHEDDVYDVAFSPCGKLVASAGQDRTVRLWCARTGKPANILQGHTDAVLSIVFSPSGHQLASGGGGDDGTVRLWDIKTGEPGFILEGHTEGITGLAFSPSGHQIASWSEDMTVRLWCTLTGEQLMNLHHEDQLNGVMFSPNGLEVISSSWVHSDLCCWDTQSGEKINQLTLGFCILSSLYSPCGKLLATGDRDGGLRLWSRNLEGGDWSEVYQSFIGSAGVLQWRQGLDAMYLVSYNIGIMRVWGMKDLGGSYTLSLLWSLGRNELSLADTDLSGAVGLSPVDLKLIKQRGAVSEPTGDSE
ncbi:hypothetical protein BGX24_000918, partial [Mortierella sp. AD032]